MKAVLNYLRHLWAAICGNPGRVWMPEDKFDDMTDRIARYERRAAGQRAAIARRAQKSEGATPAAPQSLAQE